MSDFLFTVIDPETGQEANCERIALNEEWAKDLVYCDVTGFAITEDGCLMMFDDCGSTAYPPLNRFKIVWNE